MQAAESDEWTRHGRRAATVARRAGSLAMREAEEIRGLKQAPPFRYVDGVLAAPAEAGTLYGWVDLRPKADRLYEPLLQGCFLLEAMAQLSGLLLRRRFGLRHGGVLTAVRRAQFPAEAAAGRVDLEARIAAGALPHFSLICAASQHARLLADCRLDVRINER